MKFGRPTVLLTKKRKGKARNRMGNWISVPGMIQNRLGVFNCCTSTSIQKFGWVPGFGRCFLSASIAGGTLRKIVQVQQANIVSNQLHEFSTCQHHSVWQIPCGTCTRCAKELFLTAKPAIETVIPAAQLSIFTSKAALTSKDGRLRELAQRVASVLLKAIEVRIRFFEAATSIGAQAAKNTKKHIDTVQARYQLFWMVCRRNQNERVKFSQFARNSASLRFGTSSNDENLRS